MNKNFMRRAIWLGALISLVGWVSWATAAGPQRPGVPHPCDVAFADRPADSILSDGGGIYTNGVDGTEAKLADLNNGEADHLYLVVGGVRNLTLKIPGVTDGAPGGVQTCDKGIFQPYLNSSDYQFYNDLPIGASTSGDQNFGGSFECRFGPSGQYTNLYGVSYESQCIVITHTAEKVWTLTADAGCTAKVNKILKRKVVDQWVGVDVPFQLTATELP